MKLLARSTLTLTLMLCAAAQPALAQFTITSKIGGGPLVPPAPVVPPPPPPVSFEPTKVAWSETATCLYYDHDLSLGWSHAGVPCGDTKDAALGAAFIGVRDTAVTLPTGPSGDILIRSTDAVAFGSRENPDPALRPTCSTGLVAADVVLAPSQQASTGTMTYLSLTSDNALLLACPAAGTVTLRAIKVFGHGSTLTAFTPDAHPVLPVMPILPVDGRVVLNIAAKDLRAQSSLKQNADGTATCEIDDIDITCLSTLKPLPPADEYFLTVVMRLGADWPIAGGKLPGLTNTGQTDARAVVAGCDVAGWGGRVAHGCRWSARTGFWYGRGNRIGAMSYFYAQSPTNWHGWQDDMPVPYQTDKWFAYVERVRVNTPGKPDGVLQYWRVQEEQAFGTYSRSDIKFRTLDLPQSKINEVWGDIYCGGTSCFGWRPGTGNTAHADFSRMTVTVGMPDLTAITAEVKELNASGK